MELRKTGSGLVPTTTTVDRINGELGYVPSNVRLVTFIANNARYTWSDTQLVEFCVAVSERRQAVLDKRGIA